MDSLPAEPDPKFWIGILEKAYLSQLQSLWDERARFIQSESGLIVAEIISFEKTIEQTKSKSEANPAAFRTLLLRLKHWVDECSHKTTPFNPFSEQQRLFATLEKTLSKAPLVANYTIASSDLISEHSDPFSKRFWKAVKRRQYAWNRLKQNTGNKIRSLFKKEKLPPFKMKRSFVVRDLLHYHWMEPLVRLSNQINDTQHQNISNSLRGFFNAIDTVSHSFWSLICKQNAEIETNKSYWKLLTEGSQSLRQIIEKQTDDFKNLQKSAHTEIAMAFKKSSSELSPIWSIAGTRLLSQKLYTLKRRKKTNHNLKHERRDSLNAWRRFWSMELADVSKDLDLVGLQYDALLQALKGQENLNDYQNNSCVPAFEKIQIALTNFQSSSPGEAFEELKEHHNQLIRLLRRTHVPELQTALFNQPTRLTLDAINEELGRFLEQLPEVHVIIRNKRFTNGSPDVKTSTIPLKELVASEVFQPFSQQLEKFKQESEEKNKSQLRKLSEIEPILEANWKAAFSKHGDQSATIKEFTNDVLGGVVRAISQIRLLQQRYIEGNSMTASNLLRIVERFGENVQAIADNEKLIELKLRLVRAQFLRKLAQWKTQSETILRTGLPLLLRIGRSYYRQGTNYYRRLQKIAGLSNGSRSTEERISSFALQTEQRISSLPYIYQHLFRLEALEESQFFHGRKTEMLEINKYWKSYMENQNGSLAIIGEKGTGMTSFLHKMLAADDLKFSKSEILWIKLTELQSNEIELSQHIAQQMDLDRVKDLDSLEAALQTLSEVKVYFIEGLQSLYLRVPGGTSLLRRLLLFFSRTQSKIFWIATCTEYSWRYLCKSMQIDMYFNHVISLPLFSRLDLEEFILKRHRLSGYQLKFAPHDDFQKSSRYKSLKSEEDKQRWMRKRFFELLHDASGGNATSALLHWLMSIRDFTEDTVTLKANPDNEFSFMENLPGQDFFTLASILQQDAVTVDAHSKIFQIPEMESSLQLARLKRLGLVIEKSGRLEIHPIFYRPAVRLLQRKNLILS